MCRASAERRAQAMVAAVILEFGVAAKTVGLTLQQRADLIGVSRQSLYRWEAAPSECTKFTAVSVLISATKFICHMPLPERVVYQKRGPHATKQRDALVKTYTEQEAKTPV